MSEFFESDNSLNAEHEARLSNFSLLVEAALEKSILDTESFKEALLSGEKEKIDAALAVVKVSADELEAVQFRRLTELKAIARENSFDVPADLSQAVKTIKAVEEKGIFSQSIIRRQEKELIIRLAKLSYLCRQMAADSIDTLSLTYKLVSKENNPGHSLYNNYGKVGKKQNATGILDTKG